jgi:DNA-binding response OmpR family regulator
VFDIALRFMENKPETWRQPQLTKILCVDDDPDIISHKRTILERAGYEVMTCFSAEDAVRTMEQVEFDAVVTDWRLGQERGRVVVEAAKANPVVPVVVVSGYVAEAFRAAEPMADIYLEKPADPRELVQILSTLLQARTARNTALSQRY